MYYIKYIYILCIEFLQISKEIKIKKGQNTQTGFRKEDLQIINRHMKRCSTLLRTREMQIKIYIPTEITATRKADQVLGRTSNDTDIHFLLVGV